MGTTAIIPGGGLGVRMGTEINKQFLEINGKPIIAYTLERIAQCSLVDEIVVAVPADWVDFVLGDIVQQYQIAKVVRVISGGATRQESVYLGLTTLDKNDSLVLIHDAVRPCISLDLIEKVVEKASQTGAAIAAIPVRDTIKLVEGGVIRATPDRQNLWCAQTPQVFRKDIIWRAFERAVDNNVVATDDASLVEALGVAVHVVNGEFTNLKITMPEDLLLAQMLIEHNYNC